jgi:hypothetical protein
MAAVYQTASVSKQDSLTYKQESCEHAEAVHEIKVASGEAKCGQPSSHVRLPMEQDKKTKVVLKTVETAVVKIEKDDDITVSNRKRAFKDITVVEGSVNASLLSSAVYRTLQKDMNDDKRALDSSYKIRSFVVKEV